MKLAVAAAVLLLMGAVQSAKADGLRILSLDQCADQFALALAGPEDALFLSPRADDPDSHLRERARGRERVRPTLEAALAARPDVVIRYWGGEPRLLTALERRGVPTAMVEDASDFDGVRANVRRVADALGRTERGEALISEMDARLHGAAMSGDVKSALYLTPGGFTAGDQTLVGAILKAAGFVSAAPSPWFAPVSVERLLLEPPARFVLAFYEQARSDWRGAGRHPALRRMMAERPTTRLSGAVVGCPAWFVGEAVDVLAAAGAQS